MKRYISDFQLAVVFWLIVVIPAYSQEWGSLDTTFFNFDRSGGSGFNNTIQDILLLSNDKTIVAGRFTSFNGQATPGLARLYKDGTKDFSFKVEEGFENGSNQANVFSLLPLPNDKFLAIGEFSHYNGYFSPKIVRINSDGTIDPTFNIGSGFNESVLATALQPDGKVLVGVGLIAMILSRQPI
ncbi:delta-60 repeat domain-containing protein [Cyclobacterium qasimii]|uniref:Uncharacterized protein n=1 Tax=Cyclobacterium qasimii M12-11B TaxID=641524 RepID=S7X6L5_9BACT|nr:delta-60 repeat domain-containing protein [Cyclobacterium qasimii]EPR71683.1 hypothetical protein ADICYQ_0154 [Cyclobacterium qasimii M12-11B]